jgi:hypothetical protein
MSEIKNIGRRHLRKLYLLNYETTYITTRQQADGENMESQLQLRRYGVGGDRGGIFEDKRRCVHPIAQPTATLITIQCRNSRGYGPGGLYCPLHADVKVGAEAAL